MSFFDGIVNAARSVLGISAPAPASEPKQPADDAPKRGNVAIDSATTYERASTTTPQRQSLVERLETIRSEGQKSSPARTTPSQPRTGMPAPSTTAPHERADRSEQPPSGSTIVEDAYSGAATVQPRTQQRASARANIIDQPTATSHGTIDNLAGASSEAAVAAQHVQQGLDYYASTFGRDGLDGAGSGVNVLINDRTTDADGSERFAGNGGYYATTYSDGTVREAIHFGRGKAYEAARGTVSQYSMLHADDLTIHELTHGIIRKETGHLGGEANEAGATNEGIADVMAAAATRDWVIGEGMYGAESDYKNMRNIASPADATSIHGLYTSMAEIEAVKAQGGEPEEHWASGVISTAAYRVQQRLGGEAGWQTVERVFYDTIDQGRLGDMSFGQVANGLRVSAATAYGTGSAQYVAVDEELRRAGL